MAKGVYDKKRPTAKKVSNFDTKVIIILAVVLSVVVVGLVVAACIAASFDNYIGSVNGMRITKFDYKLTLSNVAAEMEEEAKKADSEFSSSTFWTAEKKKEAETKALDEVKKFYVLYNLAKKNGFAVSKSDKDTMFNYYANMIYSYSQMYGGTYDYWTSNMAGMSMKYEDLNSLVEYMAKYEAINGYANDYASKAMDGYALSDLKYKDEETGTESVGEDAVVAKYLAERDTFRRINLQVLALSKTPSGTKPTAPATVAEPTKPDTEDETSDAYKEYKTKLESYNKYLENKAEYEKKLKEWEDKEAEIKATVADIFNQLAETGKYTGKGIKDVEVTDEAGNKTTTKNEYKDATLEDIIKKEGVKYSDDMKEDGTNMFMGAPTTTNLLQVFANSLEWTDESRTALKSLLVERWATVEEPVEENPGEETSETEEPAAEADADAAEGGDAAEGETSEEGTEPAAGTEEGTETKEEGTETKEEEGTEAKEEEKDTDPWAKYNNDYSVESITEDGKFKETKLILIEDDSNFYIVKCTGIDDLDNSREEEPAAEDADENTIISVRAHVIRTLKSEKASEEYKAMAEELAAKYSISGKKSNTIAKCNKQILG
ncbi:MAG: hypothetical protein J5921_00130 [Clostridia bacterium]|nr:hypothetical protein [Clostridia bacterium]